MAQELWISASRMGMADDCERKHFLAYVAKIRVKQYAHPAAVVGTAFHTLMETMYSRKIWDREEVLKFVDSAWRKAVADNAEMSPVKPADLEPDKVEEHKAKIIKLFKKSYEYHFEKMLINNPDIETITEQNFQIRWPSEKHNVTIVLNGYIDRIMIWRPKGKDVKAWITDYKTQKELPTQEKVNKDKQLTFYAAAYRRMAANRMAKDWPKTESFVELFFPVEPSRLKATRSKEDFDELKISLDRVAELHLTKAKKATPSDDACKFCPYKFTEHCEESREYVYKSR
jgi:ATP-dependent helicase/DNAse subunit B